MAAAALDTIMRNPSTRSAPLLPAGHSAGAAWGFHDADGFAYEFFRVYGEVGGTGARGSFCQLDEDLSYWAVTWPVAGEPGDEGEHIAWRSVNFEQARLRTAAPLDFHRFSSPLAMRAEIPRMLMAGGLT